MSEGIDCTKLLPAVIALAREAGHAVMDLYRDGRREEGLRYKADHSPVTPADLAAHRILQGGLLRLRPEWPVLSEESAEVRFSERKCWRHFWLVDPLDGTQEFLHGTGEFTINVALIENGEPVLGVVFAPAMNRLYYGARGAGSFRVCGEEAQAARVSAVPANAGETRVVVSRRHRSKQETEQAAEAQVLTMGSSLKFCLIAEGTADVYPRSGPTMEWDTAAGQCIVEQAGGTVTGMDGNRVVYNKAVLSNTGFVARGRQSPALS
jgi:3'(2'), 5'-bisphosphate nucleotidase